MRKLPGFARSLICRSEVPIMSRDFPVEKNVFHLWLFANVVNDHVPAAPAGLLINDDADVRHVAAQVPGDKIPGRVVLRVICYRQEFSLALEKHHQIGNAAVVYIRVRMGEIPSSFVRIRSEVPEHILMDLFLQVDAHSAVTANHLVGADTGVRRDVAARIRDSDIGRNMANRMMRTLYSRSDETAREIFVRTRR